MRSWQSQAFEPSRQPPANPEIIWPGCPEGLGGKGTELGRIVSERCWTNEKTWQQSWWLVPPSFERRKQSHTVWPMQTMILTTMQWPTSYSEASLEWGSIQLHVCGKKQGYLKVGQFACTEPCTVPQCLHPQTNQRFLVEPRKCLRGCQTQEKTRSGSRQMGPPRFFIIAFVPPLTFSLSSRVPHRRITIESSLYPWPHLVLPYFMPDWCLHKLGSSTNRRYCYEANSVGPLHRTKGAPFSSVCLLSVVVRPFIVTCCCLLVYGIFSIPLVPSSPVIALLLHRRLSLRLNVFASYSHFLPPVFPSALSLLPIIQYTQPRFQIHFTTQLFHCFPFLY